MNIESLLSDVSGASPSGSNLREELRPDSLYFRLKDARGQARAMERDAETSGEPATLAPAWATVRTLAIEALSQHSKDVEVAAWLVEALVRSEGFAGLSDGLMLFDGLVERFWPKLFSPDQDDVTAILAPIAGLNGLGSDGPLVQAIRMTPLIPGHGYGTLSMWHCLQALRNPDSERYRELAAARAGAGVDAMRKRSSEARAAQLALAKLTDTLTARCGPDAPPTSKLRAVLEEVLDTYRVLLGGEVPAPAPVVPATPTRNDAHADASPRAEASTEAISVAEAPLPPQPRDITNREQAFAELLRIADYFRRSEPHSPISYALETLVRRGRMELVDLLGELLPDAGSRLQFLLHAGIQAQADGAARKQ